MQPSVGDSGEQLEEGEGGMEIDPSSPLDGGAGLAIPAVDPHQHGLAPNAIGVLQSIVISVANSAPTAAMTVTFAGLVVIAAGGGAIAIFITMLPMLVIAYSFQRLNRWEANCGAQYVWVGRAVGPRLGFMTGWVVLGALMLGTVATVLPVGPSFLDLVGLNSSSQFGSVASSTVLMLIVTAVAVAGITLTARVQIAMAAIEYSIVGVLTLIGLWDTFVSQPSGFVSPSWSWLSPTGVGGAGDLVGTLLLAVFLIAGWDASLYVNEETENAEVNPGRAVMISVIFLGLFYMLMMFAFQAVASTSAIDAHAAQGLSFAADRVAGRSGDKAMSLAVLLSAVATTQIGFVTLSRVSYAMGTDGLLPQAFGQLHRRYRTPAFGTILFAAITIIVTAAEVYSSSVSNAFAEIVATTGVLYGLFYAISAVTNTWYFRSQLREGAGNLLLVGILPLASAGFLGWIIVKSVTGFTRGENLTLLGVLVSGLVMLAIAHTKKSPFFNIARAKYGDDA
jgi:amino acid transporter